MTAKGSAIVAPLLKQYGATEINYSQPLSA